MFLILVVIIPILYHYFPIFKHCLKYPNNGFMFLILDHHPQYKCSFPTLWSIISQCYSHVTNIGFNGYIPILCVVYTRKIHFPNVISHFFSCVSVFMKSVAILVCTSRTECHRVLYGFTCVAFTENRPLILPFCFSASVQ